MAGPFYGDGAYQCQILDVALGESKNQNPQIVLRVKILAGARTNSEGQIELEHVSAQYDRTIYLTVTEKSKDMVLSKLRNAGWQGDRFETLSSDLLGRICYATNTIEASKSERFYGQQTERWDLQLPPREFTPLENDPGVAKKLNALFGKSLKTTAAAPAAAAVAQESLPPGAPPQDEIPF